MAGTGRARRRARRRTAQLRPHSNAARKERSSAAIAAAASAGSATFKSERERLDRRRPQCNPERTYDLASGFRARATGHRLVRTRISTLAPKATAYFSMVLGVGRVHTPLSGRDTTLLVVHILAAAASCVILAAVRAATGSATRRCNVRSVLSARACLFSRSPVTEARLLART